MEINCPICKNFKVVKKLNISFSEGVLPSKYDYYYCKTCNFGFSRPEGLTEDSLTLFYGSINRSHTSDTDYRHDDFDSQIRYCREILQLQAGMKVLDFGCAEGVLLTKLHNEFEIPFENLFGLDVFPNPDAVYNHFESLNLLSDLKFDVIILSHVLEHLLDFNILTRLQMHLMENGKIYIEIPNSSLYSKYPRSTPGYYFDRLHLNHFSPEAIARLMQAYHFEVLSLLESTFTYSDGLPYPVLQAVFRPKTSGIDFISDVMEVDRLRIEQINQKLSGLEIIVWGLGDNFYRANSLNFFQSLNIVAVVDANLDIAVPSHFPKPILIADALENFPEASVLLMMSWGKEDATEIVKSLNRECIVIDF
jgi:hypothetical protein